MVERNQKEQLLAVLQNSRIMLKRDPLHLKQKIPVLSILQRQIIQSKRSLQLQQIKMSTEVIRMQRKRPNLTKSIHLRYIMATKIIKQRGSSKNHKNKSNNSSSKVYCKMRSKKDNKIPIINQIIYNTELNNLFFQLNKEDAKDQQTTLQSIAIKEKIFIQKSYLLPLNKIRKGPLRNPEKSTEQLPRIYNKCNFDLCGQNLFKKGKKQKNLTLERQRDTPKRDKKMSQVQKNNKWALVKSNQGTFYSKNDIVPWDFKNVRYKTDIEDVEIIQ